LNIFEAVLENIKMALGDRPLTRQVILQTFWSYASEERYKEFRMSSAREREILVAALGNAGLQSNAVLVLHGHRIHILCWERSSKVWVIEDKCFGMFFAPHLADPVKETATEGGHTPPCLERTAGVHLVPSHQKKKLYDLLVELGEIPPPIAKDRKISRIEWEILPPGELLFEGSGSGESLDRDPEVELRMERLRFLDSLNPVQWWQGKVLGSSAKEYLVAEFAASHVAECAHLGNAAYYVTGDKNDQWQSVFQLSKADAIASGANRVLHTKGWQDRLLSIVIPATPT
jgi:hypothetical protein